jgi:hypothetical protein
MFNELLNKSTHSINTIRSIIKFNEHLRDKLSATQNSELLAFKQIAPNLDEWKSYERCSVVTRLYAIYESFVENIIKDWIISLPEIFESYAELPEKIQTTHQIGAAKLLQELGGNNNRYEHLSVPNIIKALYIGAISSQEKYELVTDAFILHNQNLRKDILVKLFADAGISQSWDWIENHRYIKEIANGSRNYAETQIKELIDYRNQAAHSDRFDESLGINKLLEMCDVVEKICQALTELVTYEAIEHSKSKNKIQKIGKVTDWLPKKQVAIASCNKGTLAIGNNIFVVSKTKCYCQSVQIKNIRIDENGVDVNKTKFEIVNSIEIALQIDKEVKKDLDIYLSM